MHFLCYVSLYENPEAVLGALAETIETEHPTELMSAVNTMRAPRPQDIDLGFVDPTLVEEARSVCEYLRKG